MRGKVWIVDIDDTLTISQNENPTTDAEWEAMFANAKPNLPLIYKLQSVVAVCDIIVICTGRKEKNRAVTKSWLDKFMVYHDLLMRDDSDNRSPVDVKRDLYQQIKKSYDGYPLAVIDDDDNVRRMAWAEMTMFALHPTHAASALVSSSEVHASEFKPLTKL